MSASVCCILAFLSCSVSFEWLNKSDDTPLYALKASEL